MSLDNDPFDLPPEPPPASDVSSPAPAQTTETYPPPMESRWPRVPLAVWIALGILALALLVAIVLLLTLLRPPTPPTVTPTPQPTVAQPTVVAVPDTVTGGTVVTLQGSNMMSNDRVIFYLRDPSQPSAPILQIGTTMALADGSFVWSFIYPTDLRWTSINSASVIVQSAATGGYLTVSLTVVPTGSVPTIIVPTVPPPTPGPTTLTALPPTSTFTPPPQPTLTQTPDPNQWRGEYFNNPNLQGAPVMVRNDPSINFNWGTGSPAPNIPVDYFSVRWTRTWIFDGGMYRFTAQVDDGIRVWLDNQIIIDEWHTATPNAYVKDVNVTAGTHSVRVEYYEGVGLAFINFNIGPITSYPDWKGDYFNNPFLGGPPTFTRNDVAVSFDWGNSSTPAPGVPHDQFSARWTRTVNFDAGLYTFSFRVDDGVRFFIDGNLIINEWHTATNTTYSQQVNLAGGAHTLVIEYYNQTGPAYIWFTYQPNVGSNTDWTGNYFANNQWSGQPTMIRFDPDINFDWGLGSPSPLIPVDNFSVRWTRTVNVAAGQYQFNFTVDDGVRFFVDNVLVLDQVRVTSVTQYVVNVTLTQGNHTFRIDYVEFGGNAVMKFSTTATSGPSPTPSSTATTTQTPTPTPSPTWTATPTGTSVPPAPVINSFTATPSQVTLGQCVTLTWVTTGATTPISLEVNGQPLQNNLPASGAVTHCPTTVSSQVYTLIIAASPPYGPLTATQIVNVNGPSITPTATPTGTMSAVPLPATP